MTAVVLLPALACAAPAPAPKPPPPVSRAEVVGHWQLRWSGHLYQARFCPDGFFACWRGGQTWVGSWRLEGGLLTVCERQLRPGATYPRPEWPPNGHRWAVRLLRAAHGALKGSPQPPVTYVSVELSRPGAAGP